MKKKDITGQKFGKLTAIKRDSITSSARGYSFWECNCACGNTITCSLRNLSSGNTKSCGCVRGESRRTHGMSGSREYRIWIHMKSRCYNESDSRFYTHGGRGIKVCDRWLHSFDNFLEDMGLAPSGQHSIERLDNNGDYRPENCTWADFKEQANNKRTNWYITHNGETKTIKQWSEVYGVGYQTLLKRVRDYGWPFEKAVTTKPKKSSKTSDVRGVTWSETDQRWRVRVRHKGVVYNGGRFKNKNEAEEAANKLREMFQ